MVSTDTLQNLRGNVNITINKVSKGPSSVVIDSFSDNKDGLIKSYVCPFKTCLNGHKYKNLHSCVSHVNNKHIMTSIPSMDMMDFLSFSNFVSSYEMWICKICLKLCNSRKSKCLCKKVFDERNSFDIKSIIILNDNAINNASLCNFPNITVNEDKTIETTLHSLFVKEDDFIQIRLIRCKLIKCIPKKCVVLFNKLYCNILKNISKDPMCIFNWSLLFIYAKCVLRVAPEILNLSNKNRNRKSKVNFNKIQNSFTLKCLQLWESGNSGILNLWNEVLSSIKGFDSSQGSFIKKVSESKSNIFKCIENVKKGRLSKAVESLLSLGVHDSNDANVINILKEKHPINELPNKCSLLDMSDEFNCLQDMTIKNLKKLVLSFDKYTGSGFDGFKVVYWHDILDSNIPIVVEDFLSALKSFVYVCLKGRIPNMLASSFMSAPLLPLIKNDNGVRPIAVGEVHRRLVSKVALSLVKNDAKNYLNPFQFGVGIKSGAEGIIHSVNKYIFDSKIVIKDSSKVILKIDFNNAFNSINRSKMLSVVKDHFPSIFNWTSFCYSNAAKLFCGENIIDCTTGVQQGDPLAPLLFSITLQELLLDLSKKFPNIQINCWYLDDGILIVEGLQVNAILDYFLEVGPSFGLFLNLEKCEVISVYNLQNPDHICNNNLDFVNNLVKKIYSNGFEILGCPIGNQNYCELFLKKKLTKIRSLCDYILQLDNYQISYILLKYCALFPKINYLLRNINPNLIQMGIAEFDEIRYSCIKGILGNDSLTDEDLNIISLPIKLSGFGLVDAKSVSLAAYVGSVGSTLNIQKIILKKSLTDSVKEFDSFCSNINFNGLEINAAYFDSTKKPQKDIIYKLNQIKYHSIVENSSNRLKKNINDRKRFT